MAIQLNNPFLEVTDGYGNSTFTTSFEAGFNMRATDDGYGFVTIDGVRPNIKTVNLSDGEFSSIKAAVDSIVDATVTNPYVLDVAPGLYIEDTITMKPYVWIRGAEQDQTIIQVNATNKHVILGADNSGISRCRLHGATTSGFAAVYHQSQTGTIRDAFFVEDCRFGNNDTLVIADSTDAPTSVFIDNCKFGGNFQFNKGFLARNGGRILFRNSTTTAMTAPYPEYVAKAIGLGSQLVTNGLQIRPSSSTVSGTVGIHLADGASLLGLSAIVFGFGTALYVENTGAASTLQVAGMLCLDNDVDLQVDHPGADGTFTGSADHHKVFVDPAASLSVVITCNRAPDDGTGSVTVGSILQGDRYDRLANLSLLAREATSLGVIDGGNITVASGFDVDISSGLGFLIEPTDLYVQEIAWDGYTLTLAPDSINYIYVDTHGHIHESASQQSLITTIPLGRVVTDSTGIRFIEPVEMDMVHVGNKVEAFLRNLGPVFGQGAIVSENGTRQIDVSAGTYNYGINPLFLDGGTTIEWTAFYQDGYMGWSEIASQDIVDNAQYDDGYGSLVSIPSGQYVKHILHAIGTDGYGFGSEKYFLVYGQEVYPTKEDAIAGGMPLVPPFISDAVVRIASFVVQEGVANIQDVSDIRPRIGFAAASTAGTTNHGNLLGLSSDDHPQYFLANGTRPMSGNINVGNNNITNVNLVDGVDVSDHSSRHLPNGLDPLTTAAGISVSATTTNAIGTANSLSRSDHGHDVLTGTPSTQIPDQANAEGTSADLARADHIHNIPTEAPSGSLGADSTNTEGASTSFSRADHTHDMATGVVSQQLADQSNAEGTSNNLARADHIHNIPTAIAVSVGTANAQGASTSLSKADHVHQGIHSLDVNGGTDRYGDITLQQGANVTIVDNGAGTFTINAENTGAGFPATRGMFDDFLFSDIGTTHQALSWQVTAANGGTGILEATFGDNNYQGAVILGTGTTNNSTGRSAVSATDNRNVWTAPGAKTGKFNYHEWRVMFPTLADGTTSYVARIGLQDNVLTGTPVNGVYMRYSNNVNSGQWVGRTVSSSIGSSVNSSIPIVAGQWYVITMKIDAAGTSVEFFVDGVSIGTSSSNIPTTGMRPVALIEKQAPNSNQTRLMYIDYFYNLKERI